MQTREQLLAKHAKELAELAAQEDVIRQLPVIEGISLFHVFVHKESIHLDYERKNIERNLISTALDVFDAYQSVPLMDFKHQYRSVRPRALYKDIPPGADMGDFCAYLEATGTDIPSGIYHKLVLVFWAQLPEGRLTQVSIPLCEGAFNHGGSVPLRLLPTPIRTSQRREHRWEPNAALKAYADRTITFKPFDGADKGYKMLYLFTADDIDHTMFSHFKAQMRNLADEFQL